MRSENIIPFAPALERQRRVVVGISLMSWNNNFRDGIEDIWSGPFVPARSGTVVPLVLH